MIQAEWIAEWFESQKARGQYVDMVADDADWAVLDGDFYLSELAEYLNAKLNAAAVGVK